MRSRLPSVRLPCGPYLYLLSCCVLTGMRACRGLALVGGVSPVY